LAILNISMNRSRVETMMKATASPSQMRFRHDPPQFLERTRCVLRDRIVLEPPPATTISHRGAADPRSAISGKVE